MSNENETEIGEEEEEDILLDSGRGDRHPVVLEGQIFYFQCFFFPAFLLILSSYHPSPKKVRALLFFISLVLFQFITTRSENNFWEKSEQKIHDLTLLHKIFLLSQHLQTSAHQG